MLRKLLLLAAALPGLTAAASPASAADASLYRPYVQAVPAPTWTGFYAGAHLGGAINDYDASTSVVPTPGAVLGATPFDVISVTNYNANPDRAASFIGGGQIGYNLQFGQWVLGIEADYSGMHNSQALSRSNAVTVGGTAIAALTTNLNIKSEWAASVRGRAGMAWGSWLLYATGGAAFTDISLQSGTTVATGTGTGGTTPVGTGADANNGKTLSGYTVGIGSEYAFSEFVSLGVEYRYSDFGRAVLTTADVNLAPTIPGALFHSTTTVDTTSQQITARLNVRFGGLFGVP